MMPYQVVVPLGEDISCVRACLVGAAQQDPAPSRIIVVGGPRHDGARERVASMLVTLPVPAALERGDWTAAVDRVVGEGAALLLHPEHVLVPGAAARLLRRTGGGRPVAGPPLDRGRAPGGVASIDVPAGPVDRRSPPGVVALVDGRQQLAVVPGERAAAGFDVAAAVDPVVATFPQVTDGPRPRPMDRGAQVGTGEGAGRAAILAGRVVRRLRRGMTVGAGRTWAEESEATWRAIAADPGRRSARSDPSVLYLLPGLGAYGGVISAIQLVNRLRLRGVPVTLATTGPVDPGIHREPMLVQPWAGGGIDAMLRDLPPHDVVVATSWATVFDALRARQYWGARTLSLVQDDDPSMLPDGSPEQAASRLGLELVRDKVVKSQWLEERVRPSGGRVHRVPLGLNLDVFHPGEAGGDSDRVLSAARPGAEHRNLEGTVDALRKLQQRRPASDAVFFGRPFEVDNLRHVHLGSLRQPEVAAALRGAGCLLDASLFQGFGRPGLEAMACGVPAVLTRNGGINEYARHDENCLQVDPVDADSVAEAVDRVMSDQPLADRLVAAGRVTAAAFDAELEADRTAALLRTVAHA